MNPLLGGSFYSLGLVLCLVLAGLALGGLVYAWPGRRDQPTRRELTFGCALLALGLALGWALGDRLVLLASWAQASWPRFPERVLGWAIVTGALVLLPAILWGYLTPLVMGLIGRGPAGVAPWEEAFLRGRAALYRQLGSPAAARAAEDVRLWELGGP